jgi:hypothetical protein
MEIFGNPKVAKSSTIFCCNICDYSTSKKYNYDKHLLTGKHMTAMVGNQKVAKSRKSSNSHLFTCQNCNKTYSDNSGLWKHKKKCSIFGNSGNSGNVATENIPTNEVVKEVNETKQQQIIEYLIKENNEFKQFMIEQNKQMLELAKNSGYNMNINNSNSFNINLFLNETCKNAMNIMDFVNQLKIDNNDLEATGRLGFAEGISKIFIDGLKNIYINDRPIHCSNLKKETLYIKNNNEWNKETNNKTILMDAIKKVAHKNIKQITEWTKEHPEFNNISSKQNDKYLRIVCESMCGSTEEETNKNYSKIIKNIIKETVIEKNK